MLRKVTKQVKGYRTKDGAGVSLVRVLGSETVYDFDPFLMLDSFDFEQCFQTHRCVRRVCHTGIRHLFHVQRLMYDFIMV